MLPRPIKEEFFKRWSKRAGLLMLIPAIIFTYTTYGTLANIVEDNKNTHIVFARELKRNYMNDSVRTAILAKIIRNQDVAYRNLLELAKKQGYRLSREEDMFITDPLIFNGLK